MALSILQTNGCAVIATDIYLVPASIVLLAEVLSDQVGANRPDLIWFGSPTWVISGMISDHVMTRIDGAIDNRRIDDVQRLFQIASDNSEWIPVECLTGVPTTQLPDVQGYGPDKSIFKLVPNQTGWLSSKGNFHGVSRSREHKAKTAMGNLSRDYVIAPWESSLKIRNISTVSEIPYDRIISLSEI